MYKNYLKVAGFVIGMIFLSGFEGCPVEPKPEKYLNSNPTNPAGMQSAAAPSSPLAAAITDVLNSLSGMTVRFPAGAVFNIGGGEFGPTGTFTTTSPLIARLVSGFTGSSTSAGINNGEITFTANVSGTYNYYGTDVTDGTLTKSINLTGVYATGTVSTTGLFQAGGSPTGIIVEKLQIFVPDLKNIIGLFHFSGGADNGKPFEIMTPFDATISGGNLEDNSDNYTGATVTILSSCLTGLFDSNPEEYHVSANGSTITVKNAVIFGTTVGAINGIQFNGADLADGDVEGLSAVLGSCP